LITQQRYTRCLLP